MYWGLYKVVDILAHWAFWKVFWSFHLDVGLCKLSLPKWRLDWQWPQELMSHLFSLLSPVEVEKMNISKPQNFKELQNPIQIFCELDARILPLTFGKTSFWFLLRNHFRYPPRGILEVNGATFWEHTDSIRLLCIRTKERKNHLSTPSLTMVVPNTL